MREREPRATRAWGRYFRKDHPLEATTAIRDLPDSPKPPLSGWGAFALFFVLLSLCYVRVLVTSYAMADEYALLWAEASGASWPRHVAVALGRPTQGILDHLLFSPMRDIGDLCYIRFLSVLFISTLAWAVYRALLQAGWNWREAFFLSLITATLPPFQVYASWAETAPYPLSAVSAAGAFCMTEWGRREQRPWRKWSLAAASALLVLLAISTFQPGAMFFWVFAAIVIFTPDATIRCLLRRLLWYGTIVGTGMVLGFGIYEWGLAHYRRGLALYGADYGYIIPPARAHLTKNVLGKALWFVQSPIVDALNLVNLHSNSSLAYGIAIIGSCGMVLYFRGSIKERLLKCAIALALLPISYLPNLLTAENWPSYRTQLALTSLVLLYTFFALCGYARLMCRQIAAQVITVVLGVAALGTMLLAAHNVQTYFAFPLSLELRLIRSQLTSGNLRQARSIYVIGLKWTDSIAPLARYDEFGLPFSAEPWGSEQAVHVLLRELGYPGMSVKVAPVGGPIKPPDGALVVDMRKLATLR
jgi:hypothetical protein